MCNCTRYMSWCWYFRHCSNLIHVIYQLHKDVIDQYLRGVARPLTLSTAFRGNGEILHVIDCGEEGGTLSCSIEIESVYSCLAKNNPNSEHGTQYKNEFC